MEAGAAASGAAVERRRRAQPNGWWGMALFLCAEVTLFGTLIATYFYLDFDARAGRRTGSRPPSIVLPLLATGGADRDQPAARPGGPCLAGGPPLPRRAIDAAGCLVQALLRGGPGSPVPP